MALLTPDDLIGRSAHFTRAGVAIVRALVNSFTGTPHDQYTVRIYEPLTERAPAHYVLVCYQPHTRIIISRDQLLGMIASAQLVIN